MAKLLTKKKNPSKEGDELRGFGQQIWLLATEKPRLAASVIGGAAGILLLVLLALFLTGRAEERRHEKVATAIDRYVGEEAEAADPAAVTEELRTVARKYSRFAEGGQALYFLAGMLAEEGQYQAAVESYQKVIDDYVSLSNSASLGLAYTFRLMGDDEKALEAFRSLLSNDSTPVPETQIYMEIGLIYEEQGRNEEALSTYRSIVDSFPESPLAERARQRINLLKGA